jgi:deaminated glutathione amidase
LHQASNGEELIPIEIDMERVKRSRELGVLRLGQPLKSFRDRKVNFDIYKAGVEHPYLNTLGGLNKPTRFEQMTETLQAEEPITADQFMNKK